MILPRSWYSRETVTVAQELLGTYLVCETAKGKTVGKIIETEAYLGVRDPAAHSYRGQTTRTTALFGEPGTIYIYLIYGLHYCFNVVTGQAGQGEAVLIRALEPVDGIELMKQRRKSHELTKLCSGPARLVSAMGIDPSLNGGDISQGGLTIRDEVGSLSVRPAADEMVTTTRVGITKAHDLPLRFYLKDNPYISRK